MFAIILRVHVTVGNPVSLFALKVTPHFDECLQKNKLHAIFTWNQNKLNNNE